MLGPAVLVKLEFSFFIDNPVEVEGVRNTSCPWKSRLLESRYIVSMMKSTRGTKVILREAFLWGRFPYTMTVIALMADWSTQLLERIQSLESSFLLSEKKLIVLLFCPLLLTVSVSAPLFARASRSTLRLLPHLPPYLFHITTTLRSSLINLFQSNHNLFSDRFW